VETAPDPVPRRLAHVAVDALLEFGAYPQSSGRVGKEPIRWRVLDRCDGVVLLLSDRILDCKRYHHELVETTWRDCDLRAWLNAEFFAAAFGDDERKLVEATTCTDNGDGAPDTVDSVFLLSVKEVRALTDPSGGGHPRRSATSTEFARAPKADGCRLYVYDKGVERDYVLEDGERHGCSWWWTRTQLQVQDGRSSRAAFIGARGDVKSYGRVDLPYYGVRPAVRLRIPVA
jgi:Family of unknown function (DUF6273)